MWVVKWCNMGAQIPELRKWKNCTNCVGYKANINRPIKYNDEGVCCGERLNFSRGAFWKSQCCDVSTFFENQSAMLCLCCTQTCLLVRSKIHRPIMICSQNKEGGLQPGSKWQDHAILPCYCSAPPKLNNITQCGDWTHDHTIKSRALYRLS